MDGARHAPAGILASADRPFYRWLPRFDRHDLSILEKRSYWLRNIRQPTWTASVGERVPAWPSAEAVSEFTNLF